MARLDRYHAKRDLQGTPEPGDDPVPAGTVPRFVVQEHGARRLHWDLRLEHDGVLASWALPRGIPGAPGDNRIAVRTEDHPLAYLTFSGDIPAGAYGAGTMTIWDRGTFEPLTWTADKVEVALHGERVTGRYALFAMEDDAWMIHRMDPPQEEGRTAMPEGIAPMLATAGPLPDGTQWSYEVKWDGARAMVFSQPGRLRIVSRGGEDVTDRYPELHRGARALSMHEAVLDGEIVRLGDDGRPDFGALQPRMQLRRTAVVRRLAEQAPVTLMLFDLLWLDGRWLGDRPAAERRRLLEGLGLDGERWRVPAALAGDADAVLAVTAQHGLEGVVAKRLDAPYEPGRRSPAWVKTRHREEADVVVGGWVAGTGARRGGVGGLLVGEETPDGLRYLGRVGSGLTDQQVAALTARLTAIAVAEDPFTSGPARPEAARYCRPQVRCRVAFAERTASGVLRQPVVVALLDQAPPAPRGTGNTTSVQVDGRPVRFTNPGKVLYPETATTKADVLRYLLGVAPALRTHLAGRPLTMRRWPDGVTGEGFFAKAVPPGTPAWVARAPGGPSTGGEEALVIGADADLAWLANLAALELHVPLARVAAPERADAVVFDLDPGAPAGMRACCRVALLVEGMLAGLGLRTFAKTSGSKGLQVHAPLNGPGATFAATKAFSRAVARTLTGAEPDLVVARQARDARVGKVLVDWGQNDPARTTVAAYSLRALSRPTVSTPVTWDEVRACADGEREEGLVFGPDAVLERVAAQGDLFAPVAALTQVLPG